MLSSSFRFIFYMLWSSLCQTGILKHSMTNCKVRHVIVHLQLYTASVSLSLVGLLSAKIITGCILSLAFGQVFMRSDGKVTKVWVAAWCGCAASSMNKDWLWPRGCIRCPMVAFILFHRSATLAVQYLLLSHWQWQYVPSSMDPPYWTWFSLGWWWKPEGSTAVLAVACTMTINLCRKEALAGQTCQYSMSWFSSLKQLVESHTHTHTHTHTQI